MDNSFVPSSTAFKIKRYFFALFIVSVIVAFLYCSGLVGGFNFNSNFEQTVSINVSSVTKILGPEGLQGALSPNTVYFLPVNIINSQGTDTGKNFQQLITFNAVPYQQIETDNLGNIRFYEGNTELYSWCESGCTSSSTNATFWVKIPNGIPAQTTITINLTFEPSANSAINYDGVYAGEAPQLSPNYAEYDNGANVFSFYDNFVGVNNWYAINCGSQGALVSQKLTLITGRCSSGAMVVERNKYSPQVFEVLWTGQPQGGVVPLIGITNIAQITDIPAYKPWFFQGYSVQYTNGRLGLAVTAPSPTGGTTKQSIGTSTQVPQISDSIVGIYWSGDGGLETMYLNNKPIATETDTSLNRQQFSDQYNFYIGVQTIGAQPVQPAPASSAGSSSGSASETFGYARLRYYPPDGIMPTADVGTQIGTLFGVNVNPEYIAANVGDTATFNGIAYGGTPPYTYQWYQMSESGNYQISSSPSLMLSPLGTQSSGTTTGRYYFYLTTTDSNNIQQTSPDVALDIGTSCPTSLPEPNTIAFSFNNTGLKTPAPYQVNVTVDLSNYTMKTAPDLGNIRFYDGKTPLNSWCESGCFSATSGMWYANMTLLNTKLDPEPLGYMQQITFDPLQYAKYEATDLGNVRFYETSYGVLNGWCASGCSSSSSSVTFWVQIPTGISGAGTGSLVGMDIYFLPRAITFDSNSILTTLFGTSTTSLADFVNTIAQDTGALPSFPSQNAIAPTATICSSVNPVTRSMINPQNWQYLNFSPSAFFWIKLPNGIPADTNITINMTFIPNTTEYDGKIAGEAPYFSKQYGRYDNGKNVFDLYFNNNEKSLSLLYPQSGDTAGGVYISGNSVLSTNPVTPPAATLDFSDVPYVDGNAYAFDANGVVTSDLSVPTNPSIELIYPVGEKYTGTGTIPLSGVVESLSQSSVTPWNSNSEYYGDWIYECVPFTGVQTAQPPTTPISDTFGDFIGNIQNYYQTFDTLHPYEVIAPFTDYGSGSHVPGSNCNLQNYTVNGVLNGAPYRYIFPTTDLFAEQPVGAIRTGVGNSSYGTLASLSDGSAYDAGVNGDTPPNWTYAAMTYSASAPPGGAVVNLSDFQGEGVGWDEYPSDWSSTVNLIQGPSVAVPSSAYGGVYIGPNLDQWNIRMNPLVANDPANYPIPDPYDNFSSSSDAHIIVGQVGFPGQNTTYNWVRVRSVIPGIANATPTCIAPPDTGTGAGTGVVPMAKAVIKAAAVPSAATGSSSCTANVLLVTIGITPSSPGYVAYNSALSGYEALLTQRSLTWNYIVLDSYASSQGLALDPGNWISVKAVINNLETKLNPQYLIILGGNQIIPMPLVLIPQYSIPTDDPYGSISSSMTTIVPTIIVARFPGSSANEIAGMLRNSTIGRANNNLMSSVVSDLNSYLVTAPTIGKQTQCTGSSNNPPCFPSPPYCSLSLSYKDSSPKYICPGLNTLANAISSYGIQYYYCHGNGYACGSATAGWDFFNIAGNPPTFSGTITFNSVLLPRLDSHPIIIMAACWDGTILKVTDYHNRPQQPLAIAALDKGATAYIGITLPGSALDQPLIDSDIYNNFIGGKTLGQAFLSVKTTLPKVGNYQKKLLYTTQLYGDPTTAYSDIPGGSTTQPQSNVAQPFVEEPTPSNDSQLCPGAQCSGSNSTSLCGGMTANVDIVTLGITNSTPGYTAYNSSLAEYEQKLTNENLTYNYTELGSFAAAQGMTLDPSNWTSVRAVINQLENLTNPQYLVILGGINIVPMPTLKIGTENVETDDPYGGVTSNPTAIPNIIVARFPGSTIGEITGMLRNSTTGPQNSRLMISTVNDVITGNPTLMLDANLFSFDITGQNCNTAGNSNPDCYMAPPYCTYGAGCANSIQFVNAVGAGYGMQFYSCHGSGFWCGSNSVGVTIFNSVSVPKLTVHPIIMSDACYDGNIDQLYLQATNPKNTWLNKPLAVAEMDNGASVYIGNTEPASGALAQAGCRKRRPTPRFIKISLPDRP